MAKLKITAKELRAIVYPESPVITVAMSVMESPLNLPKGRL